MNIKLEKFNPLDYLTSEEAIQGYLKGAKEAGDQEFIQQSIVMAEKARKLLKGDK